MTLVFNKRNFKNNIKEKGRQNKYLISEGHQPEIELPKNYKLPESLRKAFFR